MHYWIELYNTYYGDDSIISQGFDNLATCFYLLIPLCIVWLYIIVHNNHKRNICFLLGLMALLVLLNKGLSVIFPHYSLEKGIIFSYIVFFLYLIRSFSLFICVMIITVLYGWGNILHFLSQWQKHLLYFIPIVIGYILYHFVQRYLKSKKNNLSNKYTVGGYYIPDISLLIFTLIATAFAFLFYMIFLMFT